MAFWKKLRFRKKRRNVAITYPDIATMTENLISETGIQVSSIEMNHKSDAGTQVDSKLTSEAYTQTHDALTTRDIATMTTQFSSIEMNVRCDAGTHVDSNVTCDTSTQTPKGNEQPKKRTGGDAAENEKEQIKRNFSEIDKFFEEKDCQIRKLNATNTRNEGTTKKPDSICQNEGGNGEFSAAQNQWYEKNITSLKERRPPLTERDTEDIGSYRNSPSHMQRTDLRCVRPERLGFRKNRLHHLHWA